MAGDFSRLAGAIAHDLNNPLLVIRGFTAILIKKAGPDHPFAGELRNILAASDEITNLSGHLHSLSQLAEPLSVPLSLDSLLESLLPDLQHSMGEGHGLLLKSPLPPVLIHSDAALIAQILQSMVGLAASIPHCPDPIHVGLSEQESPRPLQKNIILSVRNLDPNTTTFPVEISLLNHPLMTGWGGTLTPAGIRKAAMSLGGTFRYHAAPNGGCLLELVLPIDNADCLTHPPLPIPAPAGDGPILVVDDQTHILTLARSILEAAGYPVVVATGIPSALNQIRALAPVTPRLVLQDIVMPGGDGFECAQRILLRAPNTPILFCSGHTTRPERIQAALRQGHGFISKPFSPEKLIEKIHALIGPGAIPRTKTQ
ncbi:MAG: response regulator [Verrucomicrobiae bacterium]|nr:response regulator [Verrucomicrobiae bacterium]